MSSLEIGSERHKFSQWNILWNHRQFTRNRMAGQPCLFPFEQHLSYLLKNIDKMSAVRHDGWTVGSLHLRRTPETVGFFCIFLYIFSMHFVTSFIFEIVQLCVGHDLIKATLLYFTPIPHLPWISSFIGDACRPVEVLLLFVQSMHGTHLLYPCSLILVTPRITVAPLKPSRSTPLRPTVVVKPWTQSRMWRWMLARSCRRINLCRIQPSLERLPDSCVSSLIRAGWRQEGHSVAKNHSNIPMDRQLPDGY